LFTVALAATGAMTCPGGVEAGKNCTCRAGGHDYQLGDIICIRGHLSQCQMNQNVTSWKEVADECPRVSLPVRLAALPRSLPSQR
jgi:hypothetical protein